MLVSGHAGSDPTKQCPIHTERPPERYSNSRRASGVLRTARGQAAGPRDPKSRRSKAYSPPVYHHILSDSACRPTPLSGFAAGRQGRRFGEPQEHSPFVLGRATRSQPIAVRRQRQMQRAPTSCSPPRGVAANCPALRATRATPFTAQGCRVRPRRAPPRAADASPAPRTAT